MAILTFILRWAALPLQAILLWLLLRKRVFRTFPWFVAYTLFSVLAGSSRLVFRYYRGSLYPQVFYGTEAVYALFGFAVMYEVFRHVLRNFQRIRWFRPVFPLTIVLTVVLTGLRTATPGFRTRWAVWVLGAEMGERCLQVSMFVLLVVLVTVFGLRWRQHAFGICAGYGLYATVALLASTKFYEIGTRFTFWWGILSVGAYNCAILIWLWYFSGPVRPEPPRASQPPLSAGDLESYKEILRRVPPS